MGVYLRGPGIGPLRTGTSLGNTGCLAFTGALLLVLAAASLVYQYWPFIIGFALVVLAGMVLVRRRAARQQAEAESQKVSS